MITNHEKIIEALNSFMTLVNEKDGGRLFSFVDRNNFLGHEEGYKIDSAVLAQNELKYESWPESWINTGKILERCVKAMNCANNLVNYNQKISFNNIINPEHEKFNPEAERILYDIYKSKPGDEERTAFENAQEIFRNYDVMGYLFFVKDYSRFLPVSPGNLDKSMALLGINHKLSYNCSWENYTGFIEIVKEIQALMQNMIHGVDVRLIDAHTFLWVIGWSMNNAG